jgi:hypothetical protein
MQFHGFCCQAAGIAKFFIFLDSAKAARMNAWYRSPSCPTIGVIKSRATGKREDGMGIEILAIAAATLAVVWIIVLWGSRYFGPR